MDKKLREQLEHDMWKLALKYGQFGDTYHWTLEINNEDNKTESYEGGCGY